jgi:hypothetical protein
VTVATEISATLFEYRNWQKRDEDEVLGILGDSESWESSSDSNDIPNDGRENIP